MFVLGAGGHARVCAEVAEAAGWRVVSFIDEPRSSDEQINAKPVRRASLVELSASEREPFAIFVAFSANEDRLRKLDEALVLSIPVASLTHPFAVISPSCKIGEGSVVMPGVVVNANTTIGRGCILNTACSIDHDSTLKDGVQIAPGVHGASGILYGSRAFVGIGASLKQGIRIGSGSVVGAGAVVIRDVPEGVTVVGNPGRAVRSSGSR